MHDRDLEDRIRTSLRDESEQLPLTITPAELERRLSLRRRERTSRRLSVSAAGAAAALIVAIAAISNGWVVVPRVGSSPVPDPPEPATELPGRPEPSGPTSASSASPPTSSPPAVSAEGSCTALDAAAADRPPQVVLEVVPPGDGASAIHSGQLGSFRIAGRDIGNVGSWDHDTIAFQPATTGVLGGIAVLATDPDTCMLGVTADAVPYGSIPAITPATAIDSLTGDAARALAFRAPPLGDWFVRVHVLFETTNDSEAFSETFFRIRTLKDTMVPLLPDGCDPLDPARSPTPPTIIAGGSPGDAIGIGGETVASSWGGHETGTAGSWALPDVPDWIRIDPVYQTLRFGSDSCLEALTVEALLNRINETVGAAEPVTLETRAGEGSPLVSVTPPPTGSWAVRVRASFTTTDGSPAWSETLFPVASVFHAPTLTMRRDGGVAVSAEPGCPNYSLRSGAISADQCGAPFTVNDAAVPISVARSQSVELALSDGWQIDAARITAVDAQRVESGAFAPEHSVAFIDQGGSQVSTSIVLDPGSWILRIALNGSRNGDRFGAYYDIGLTVTPETS